MEAECAENSLRTLLWNIPESDEVILYDKGGTLPPRCFEQLQKQHWRSWAVHREIAPEMASYTYGMNHSLPMAQAPVIMLWRSDYVYPRGLYEKYLEQIVGREIALPYTVLIGGSQVTAAFVQANWNRLDPYDEGFWRENSAETYSLYESQDPVHFAIRRETWMRLGGLDCRALGLVVGNSAEFAAAGLRGRRAAPAPASKYFDCSLPRPLKNPPPR